MEAMDDIVQGFIKNLVISEAEAFKIVGIEEFKFFFLAHQGISEPLKRYVTLCLAIDEPARQYKIGYERLPFFYLYCGRLYHVGLNCELKQTGDINTEQYGEWKTMLKDDFSIRAENGLTGKRFGLVGDGTQLDHSVSPPKVVGVIHPREAMVNLRGETNMEDDGLGSDPVLRLFKKRILFSIEREGHTSTTSVGEGPGDTHTGLSVSFEVPRNKEVMTELPNHKIVEKVSAGVTFVF
ncbi:hypothetical protein L3X38_002978 [Prunus dulcis]|uniref:Zinc knuckle CX2CX4HX4C domain-containing protein n=1 Tax=Prunus dulcis TaxID=3755 RepID=A0AAD4WZZ8_PRUDU|nr:hypothetical protein L3X38_002978 [Prunus dulcis]